MASPLSQYISQAAKSYSGPVATVGQSYLDSSQYGGAQSGPVGSIFQQGGWSPDAQSVSNQLSRFFGKQQADQQQQGANGAGTGQLGSLGGDWSGVDQWNAQIQASAKKYGVDPNILKAIMKLESDGNPSAGGAPGVGGLMQVNSNVWGYGPWMTDNAANIDKGAEIFKSYLDQNNGDMYEALRGYHGYGSDGYTTDIQYADTVMGNYNQLRNTNTALGNGTTPMTSQQWTATNGNNAVVQAALQYVGRVPYVWGGIPGKGQTPYADGGGWDCSGMTYWLDQNYGSGQLPPGSHYQFQYAQQTGQLFTNTAQLQPGDLLFWDTGNTAGGGAELNRAGHVGVYIGNGQMLHAANPDQGTIISSLDSYLKMYPFLGAMHSSYSGGTGGSAPAATQSSRNNLGGWAWALGR